MASSLFSAHLKGGYIEYRYLGKTPGDPTRSRFRVIVYQYLDCASSAQQVDTEIFLGVHSVSTGVRLFSNTIALSGTDIVRKVDFACINNPPIVCYRIDRYETELDLQDESGGWRLNVQRCCRIANIVNIANSNNSGVAYSTIIYPQPGNSQLLANNSPRFAQKDTALVCANSGFTFPFEASDEDGDSLNYRFGPGLNTLTSEAKPAQPTNLTGFPSLIYNVPYSDSRPLGSQVTLNPRTGIISGIAPGQPGDYVVAVYVDEYRNGVKIAEHRKEIHISVGNCDIPKAILPVRVINCQDLRVTFESLSTSSAILSYYWDFGVNFTNSDNSIEPRPTFVYPDTGIYTVKLVVNRGGACPDSTTMEVRVFPGFFPDFTVAGVCKALPFQFTDRSSTNFGRISQWKWDFGVAGTNADTSILQNPQFSYSASGNYTISLVVSSDKGCQDSVVINAFQVADNPTIQLAFKDTLICSIDTLQLSASGPGAMQWSPAINIINPTARNPLVFPKDSITYYVTINDRGCTASDSVRVNVLKFISVNAGNDTTICLTDTIQLQPISDALSYVWTPSTFLNNPNIKNPRANPSQASTTYEVTANLGKCQAKDQITIRTVPYPTVQAGRDTTICFGDSALLSATAVGNNYNWRPANFLTSSTTLVTTARPTQSTNFILTVTDTRGCPKPVTDTINVRVIPRITPFAGRDTIIVIGQPLQLNATTNTGAFSWRPATGLSNRAIGNPLLTVTQAMLPLGIDTLRYTVTVSVPEGCAASDDILVKVYRTPPTIFVPNAFTPNGDGLNDVIKPTLAGTQGLDYFRIYNRLGQLVFETRFAGRGWDGTINGKLQAGNSFVYDCQAKDYTGKLLKQSGSFVLIR